MVPSRFVHPRIERRSSLSASHGADGFHCRSCRVGYAVGDSRSHVHPHATGDLCAGGHPAPRTGPAEVQRSCVPEHSGAQASQLQRSESSGHFQLASPYSANTLSVRSMHQRPGSISTLREAPCRLRRRASIEVPRPPEMLPGKPRRLNSGSIPGRIPDPLWVGRAWLVSELA